MKGKRKQSNIGDLCVDIKNGSAREMCGGYKMMHAGRDGRSNGVGVIVLQVISAEVVTAERWNGIIPVWMISAADYTLYT